MDIHASSKTKDEGVLSDIQIFASGTKKFEVELTSTHLQWKVEGRDIMKSCEITFLVGYKLDEKGANNPPCAHLIIYYISKNFKTEIWKCKELVLQHEDDQLLNTWKEKICTRMDKNAKRPRNLLVFVNPISGRQKGLQVYEKQVAPLFEKAGVTRHVVVTKGPTDIVETINGFDLTKIDGIVGVGGDGTFHMVTNALLRRLASDNQIDLDNKEKCAQNKSHMPVGIIPCGSGNGIAKETYGTTDAVTATLHIVTGGVMDMNAFTIHNGEKLGLYGTMFCSFSGMADAVKYFDKNRKLGVLRYFYPVIKSVVAHSLTEVEFSYLPTEQSKREDDSKDGQNFQTKEDGWRTTNGRFRNISCFFMDLKTGKFLDHLFVETTHESTGRWQIAKHMARMARRSGPDYDNEHFSCYNCKEIRIKIQNFDLSIKEEVMNIDGELFEIKDPVLSISVHNNVIQMYGHGSIKNAEEFVKQQR